jgi:uncharacterized protein (TIGR03792 family)
MRIIKRFGPSLSTIAAFLLVLLGLAGFNQPVNMASTIQGMDDPSIEWLKFRVPPQQQDRFIQLDEEIWNPVLATSPGFAGKEIWQSPEELDDVILVIHWTNRSEWKAISQDLLDETTERFNEALGEEYPLVEAKEFRLIRP